MSSAVTEKIIDEIVPYSAIPHTSACSAMSLFVYSRVSTMFTLHYYTIGNQCIQYLSVTKISISYLNLLTIVKKIKIDFF